MPVWLRIAALASATLVAASCSARTAAPLTPTAGNDLRRAGAAGLATHATIGFSVDKPADAPIAAREGVNTTILYGGAPPRGSALATALAQNGISVVDGGVSGALFYWECHRTHTVAPPPKSYGFNSYCANDYEPQVDSEAAVLKRVGALLDLDAKRPYVVGYWVLDDWPWWDSGSAHQLLQKVHALIASKVPGEPAICGFGAGVSMPGRVAWDDGTAANYSNGGCDVVGWYNYACIECLRPSMGYRLDWSMEKLLPAMAKSLEKRGWNVAHTPLYGIGQAWSGSYAKKYYTTGLTSTEMQEQAGAFCRFGATYIGWYAWDDGGYDSRTQTPLNSTAIANGIGAGIDACRSIWSSAPLGS